MTGISFAKATAERALKSFCQALAALLVADGTDLLNTAWADRLSVAAMTALLSVLTSVASAPIGGTGPSLANEVISPPAVDPGEDGHADMVTVLIAASSAIVVVALYVLLFR